MKTFHQFTLAISAVVFIVLMGCDTKRNEKTRTNSVDSLNRQFDTTLSDVRFKQWLNDTIPVLTTASTGTGPKNPGFVKRAIAISPDSLTVSVMDAYQFNVSEKKPTDTTSRGAILLNTLGVVEESPKKESTIQFEHYMFYSPSPLPHFAYEAVEEYKNIKVFVAGSSDTTTYQCLRGLIVSKTDIRKEKNGKFQKTDYDISWDGKTVKKNKQIRCINSYKPTHIWLLC